MAAKTALVSLTPSLAVEITRQNIQVVLVVPSMVDTDLAKHVSRVVVNSLKTVATQNRLPGFADVAKAIDLLASSLASFTTGQKLLTTGG